jgi:EmrB/QacA subfamily drug resistance transporter
VTRAGGYPDGYGRRGFVAVLCGLMLASFVASLDSTVVSAAVYRIGESLNDLTAQVWVTTAFQITATVSIPVYGKLSDTHGRKPMFLIGLSVFLVGSVLCAFAGSMPMLAAFRAFQGIGAGGILALTSATLGDIVAPRERAKYSGFFVATYAVASLVGPVTGGLLAGRHVLLGVDGWRWIFLINVPIGITACVVIVRVLRPGQQRRRNRRVDVPGTLALITAAVPFLLVAQRGQAWGWGAAASAVCYVIGAVGAVGFVVAERRAGDRALLTLRLFRTRGFAIGAGQSLVSNIGIFASIALVPLYLQLVRGYSPTDAGLLMLPQVAGTLIASVTAGQFTSRTGRYKVLPVTGSVLLVVGMLMLWRLGTTTPLPDMEVAMLLLGFGSGLYAQTITLSMQNSLSQADLGVATSSNSFFWQIGGMTGTAVFLSIAYSTAGGAIRSAYATASAAPAFRAAVDRAAVDEPGQAGPLRLALSGSQSALNDPAFLQRLSPALAQPFRQGFTTALDVAFLISGMVMVLAVVLALLIKELPLRTTVNAAAPETVAGSAAVGKSVAAVRSEAAVGKSGAADRSGVVASGGAAEREPTGTVCARRGCLRP